METATYTKDDIKRLLQENDKAVERAIIRLYDFQTPTEQEIRETREKNNVGFNGVDAELLTGFAKFMLERKRHLTPKQMTYARKKILKYAGQLAKIANGEVN